MKTFDQETIAIVEEEPSLSAKEAIAKQDTSRLSDHGAAEAAERTQIVG